MPLGADTRTPDPPPSETLVVQSRVIACDGGDGPLGHPRVWLQIDHERIVCPYCSRIFKLAPGAGDDHGH